MKPKVLILQKIIPNYRYALFDEINNNFDLTVGYQKKIHIDEFNFKTQKINFTSFLNLYIPTVKFLKTCNSFDAVIIMPDLHFLNFWILPFLRLKPKIISWSIGMRASYNLNYDINRKKTFLDFIFGQILNRCSANIFYYKHPLNFWKNSIDPNKVFIGFNTVKVKRFDKIFEEKKNRIIFLGSLVKGKGLFKLIKSFEKLIFKNQDSNLILDIIGDGSEFMVLSNYLKYKELSKKIFLRGAIYDDEVLKGYLKKAICLISPDQAGLSVLKSFAFGVPFVTKNNAITGGERLNIVNQYNGLLYNEDKELDEILEKCINEKRFFKKMGENAYNFYWDKANMDVMVLGFENAINYALKTK